MVDYHPPRLHYKSRWTLRKNRMRTQVRTVLQHLCYRPEVCTILYPGMDKPIGILCRSFCTTSLSLLSYRANMGERWVLGEGGWLQADSGGITNREGSRPPFNVF